MQQCPRSFLSCASNNSPPRSEEDLKQCAGISHYLCLDEAWVDYVDYNVARLVRSGDPVGQLSNQEELNQLGDIIPETSAMPLFRPVSSARRATNLSFMFAFSLIANPFRIFFAFRSGNSVVK